MRILYIITKPGAGGAQTHVRQLSKYLKEQGHEVAIMSYSGKWPSGKYFPNPYLQNSYSPFLGIKAMREIRKAVEEFKPDIVSCHSSIAGLWGRMAIGRKVPTVFTAHGWGFTPGLSAGRRIIVAAAERYAALFCKKIICVSEFDRQLALKYKIAPERKLVTVHNGVELYNANNSKNANAANLHHSHNKFALIRIIFVGRLAEQKDPELLLEAASKLSVVSRKLLVSIIGDGPKRENLQQTTNNSQLQDKVEFLGDLPRERVFEILADGDIFVLTTHYEGFPRSILEAMSFGLPVIATDVGGVSEAVDETCGILIGRGEKEELKNALEMLVQDEELRAKMGKSARVKVEKEFSLDRMIEETISVYMEIVS